MRRFLLSASALLLAAAAWAVPAYRQAKNVVQSDGSTLTIIFSGDENLAYYTTSDGLPLIQNAAGDWCYASLKAGRLTPQAALAHNVENRSESELQLIHQMNAVESLATMTSLKAPAKWQKQPLGKRVQLSGNKRGLIILAEFPDLKFATPEPYKTFEAIANGSDYKENGFFGSVRDYFRDQSRGKFDFTFDVVGPVTLPMPMEYYGKDSVGIIDYHGPDLAVHACKLVDDKINFKDYDWDNDGEIDMLFIVFAGYGQNYGAPANTIWPFKGYASHSGYETDRPFTYLDDTFIDVFACTCELYGTSGSVLNGIGTMCHEFSHCFGLKDHYGTGGTGTHPMGYYDIMDYGSYFDQARRPVGYTAYERMFCGWLQPYELKSPASVKDMKSLTNGGEAYAIYNDNFRDECFFLENRTADGWDKYLPNSGLLITHLDYFEISWRNNTVNTIQLHPRYGVVHADNKGGMSDADQEGDTYPYLDYINGNYNDMFTDYSSPAATLFNEAADGSKKLGKPVTKIDFRNSTGTASFDFMGGGPAPDLGVAEITFNPDSEVEAFGIDGVALGRFSSAAKAAENLAGSVVVLRDRNGKTSKRIFK